MAESKTPVTMRVRIGDAEIEVTGPADFVEDKIAAFMKQASTSAPHPSLATNAQAKAAMPTGKATSPAQFIKTRNVKSDVNAVLVAGYFLEKITGQENFTAQEIRDLLSKAKRPLPKNINDALNGNIRKGMVMSAGERENKMTFVLTTDGEALVESMAQTGG